MSGSPNRKPESSNRCGLSRQLASRRSSAISPRTSRSTKAGTGIKADRPSALATSCVKSLFWSGFGDTRFTGPSTSVSRRCKMARIWSSRVIHDHHCFPPPIGPPRPSRMGSSSFFRAPPRGVSTTPVRATASRVSGVANAAAADSHWRHTSARKPWPGSESSDRYSSPRWPYMPMAEAETTTVGGDCSRERVVARSLVVVTRLSRIRAFLARVHRPSMGSPARCTTASNPSRLRPSSMLLAGSQTTSSGARATRPIPTT